MTYQHLLTKGGILQPGNDAVHVATPVLNCVMYIKNN